VNKGLAVYFWLKVGNNWQYADMSGKETRAKTLKIQPGSDIGGLFNASNS
jgi:hypothetical protein